MSINLNKEQEKLEQLKKQIREIAEVRKLDVSKDNRVEIYDILSDPSEEKINKSIHTHMTRIELAEKIRETVKNIRFKRGDVVYNKTHGAGIVDRVHLMAHNKKDKKMLYENDIFEIAENGEYDHIYAVRFLQDVVKMKDVDLMPYSEAAELLYRKDL